MKFQVPCLDGSVRELEVEDRKPYKDAPFTDTTPALGQFFVYGGSLLLRIGSVRRKTNVYYIDSRSLEGFNQRETIYVNDTAKYAPINIWTGEWL